MSQTLTIEQRIEVPRRFLAEVFNGHDAERARDFFTPDVVWHGPSIGTVAGVDNIVPLLGAFIGPLSDIRAEEQDVIASQDLVALRLVVTATQTGDLLGTRRAGATSGGTPSTSTGSTTTARSASSGRSRTWRRSAASSAPSPSPGPTDHVERRSDR